MSPRGFVEQGLASSTVDLSPLPSKVRKSLEGLAEGLGETPGHVIHSICDFLVSNDAAVCEGSLADALEFYSLNFLPHS